MKFTKFQKQKMPNGFTLVEMATVVIIIGIILIPLTKLYQINIVKEKRETTYSNMRDVSNQISYFTSKVTTQPWVSSYLPCPSNRALAPNDPSYQLQFNSGNCSVAELALMPAPLIYNPASPLPTCTANGGFCIVRGAKTVAGVTTYAPVLVGGVPIRSIKTINRYTFANDKVRDGWNGSLTYAVTLSLTSGSGADPVNTGGNYEAHNGYISVIDEHDYPTAGINDDGEYILVSHGPNRVGSFSQSGQLTSLCGGVLFAKDNQNCNNDSTFVQAVGQYDANAATFYDDVLMAFKNQSAEIWTNIPDPAGGAQNITNLNLKNIGIKTANPTARLEVAGFPAAAAGTVRVNNNARTALICNKNDTNCFRMDALSGTNPLMRCAAGSALRGVYSYTDGAGVRQTAADCIPITVSSPSGRSCPAPTWIRGITMNGCLLCWNTTTSTETTVCTP